MVTDVRVSILPASKETSQVLICYIQFFFLLVIHTLCFMFYVPTVLYFRLLLII